MYIVIVYRWSEAKKVWLKAYEAIKRDLDAVMAEAKHAFIAFPNDRIKVSVEKC